MGAGWTALHFTSYRMKREPGHAYGNSRTAPFSNFPNLHELDLGGYTLLPDRLEHTMVGSYRSFEMTFEELDNVHPILKNSLDLSLASGLDRLAGLKKLGCIGVQEMDLCVGQKEIDWMKKHWQLESWVGLSPFSAGGGFYSAKNGLIAKLIKEAWPSIRLH